MENNATCPKCSSEKIIQGARLKDFGHGNIKRNLILEVVKSEAFLFTDSESRELLADVCGNCGNVELKVENFEQLWKSYEQK